MFKTCVALLLFAATLAFATPKPGTVMLNVHEPDSVSVPLNAMVNKTKAYVSLEDVLAAVPLTVIRSAELPVLYLTTRANSIPIFVNDGDSYMTEGANEYVNASLIADACGGDVARDRKKNWIVHCEHVMKSDTGGKVDDVAPGFRLVGSDDSVYASDELLQSGALVVAFVRSPDWEPLSRDILKRLDANRETFTEMNANVVCILGYRPEEMQAWNDSVKVSFPMLSDNGIATMTCYGVYDQGRLPFPTIFVIDQDGVIRFRQNFDGLEEAPEMVSIVEAVKSIKKP